MIIQFSDDTRPLLHIGRWGKAGWLFITACAFTYPQSPTTEQKRQMHQFLISVGQVMPCGVCRKHFTGATNKLGSALDGRMNLLRWVCNTRNDINRRNGKPAVSFDDMYRECVTGCQQQPLLHCTWQTISFILLLLLLLFGCYHLKKRR